MERNELEAVAAEIMGRSEMLSLATVARDEYPDIRALFNLRNAKMFPSLRPFFEGKGMSVYLGTNSSSLKIREIVAEARVSAYYMIPGEFKGLCLSGKAVADAEARKAIWVEGWERYYPAGREDPDYTVLRIDPLRARGWYEGRPFDFSL
jgi:general stress protein 26